MLLDKLNLASCWNGFLNEMERKCFSPVWSKGGGTHWWPNIPNRLLMFTVAGLGFNTSQQWPVPLKSPWVLDHTTSAGTHHIFHGDIQSWISCRLLFYFALCKKPPDHELPRLWSPPSSSLAGFLAPPWPSQLSHHLSDASPVVSAAPLPAGSGTFTPPGSFHHSPSFPCQRPDSTSFYHSPSI